MFVNWGLEARKWQISVSGIAPLSFFKAYQAVLSGVSFSVTTPNRVGEYLGRMLYLPEGNRLKSISVTLVGSLSQLLVTVILGTIGFLFLKEELMTHGLMNEWMYRGSITGLVVLVVLLLIVYWRVEWIERFLERWMQNSRHLYLIESLRSFNVQLLGKILLLSFLRYLVFLVQYYLMFSLFQITVPVGVVYMVVSVLFLAMAIVPTIALVEVGLRGELSLQLMGLFSTNSLGISLASVTIWLINLVVPALVGSVLFLSIKVFKRKNEMD
jgi:hypothetical protein